ncbi:MAG: LuxR family transcriptional regulator, partial [Natronosporangium sp.]
MTRARLSLPPLDRDGTSRMVSSMLGGEPVSTEFVDFLHRSTEGLPLAVEEAVRLLRDRVDLVRRDGEWVRRSLTELQVPPTLRDAVRERVGRLGHRAQLVLRAAAVLTEATEGTVVCRVAGLSGSQYRAGLVDAVGSGLVQEDPNGRLAFRHALMGLAVYEAIPGSERRRLHQRAGQALERTDPPPLIRLARHFREAGQVDAWCRYAERAADLADASGDHQAAAAGLDELVTAVGTSLPGPVRGRLAAKLGAAALRRTEQMDDSCWRRVETLRTVLAAGDLSPAEQAEIRNPLGRLLMQVGEYEAGEAELEWAVGQLSHAPSAQAHAMVALAWPLGSRWPVSVHARWARRAGAVEVRVGS